MKLRQNPLTNTGIELTEQASRHFKVPGQSHLTQQKKERLKSQARARARKLIRPQNCKWIVDRLPKVGETLHGITPENFVFGDLLEAIIQQYGPPKTLTVATLSMSEKNVSMFARMIDSSAMPIILVLSAYFRDTNGKIYAKIEKLTGEHEGRLKIVTARIHTKLMLFDYPNSPWVVEGSANLRSSDNIEQFTIACDRGLLEFHVEWIDQLRRTSGVEWDQEAGSF